MKKQNLAIVDVEITEPGKIPPSYYLDPSVQEALRLAIRTDVVLKDKCCPIGTKPVYGPPSGTTAAAAIRLSIARSNFMRAIMSQLPSLIVMYIAVGSAILIFLLVKEL